MARDRRGVSCRAGPRRRRRHRLAGQPEIYLVEQLRAYRNGKRANEVMTVVARALSDRDIDDLAAWYGSIRIEAKPPD